MNKKTTNTKKEPRPEWLFGMNPGAIENQEAEGQKELVASAQLPRKCNSPHGLNAAEQYHKMGIQVFTSSKGDDLFLGVKLPDGWTKEATDHSMWNKLIDDKGRVRATFFYKAAFYDRDAFINFNTRYEIGTNYDDKDFRYDFVKDTGNGELLFKTDKRTADVHDHNYFKDQDSARKQCQDFLDKNFPDHKDINAYW